MNRIIKVYFNVTTGKVQNASGSSVPSSQYPHIYYKENPILNLLLVTDNSNTPYTGLDATGLVWKGAIAQDYDSSTDVMVAIADAAFQQSGDWYMIGNSSSNAGTADETLGEISIQVNANDANFASALGTKSQLNNTFLEVQLVDAASSGANVVYVVTVPIVCRNLANQ